MKVAISGASGFIGSALVKKNLLIGNDVNILTTNSKYKIPNVKSFIANKDFSDHKILNDFFRDVDIFYNCLGETNDKKQMYKINIDVVNLFISYARKNNVKKWVQLSSVGSYGPFRKGIVDEKFRDNPSNLYEKTKTISDNIISGSGIPFSVLRPSNVFGIGMKNQSLNSLISSIKKRYFFYIGKKGAVLNYVHVTDVVSALIFCGENDKANGKKFIISQDTTIEKLVKILLKKEVSFIRIYALPLKLLSIITLFYKYYPLTLSRIRALTNFSKYSSSKIIYDLSFKFSAKLEVQLLNYSENKE